MSTYIRESKVNTFPKDYCLVSIVTRFTVLELMMYLKCNVLKDQMQFPGGNLHTDQSVAKLV